MYATRMNTHGVCGCESVSEIEEERGYHVISVTQDSQLKPI